MARKPLFETLLQQASSNLTSVVIAIIGAVAFYYITRRKPARPGQPTPRAALRAGGPHTSASAGAPAARAVTASSPTAAATTNTAAPRAAGEVSLLQRIQQKQFVGSKICAVWDIFFANGQWTDGGKARDVLAWYAFSSDLYIMCKVANEGEQASILSALKGLEGVQRHKILFCTTQKGYEAFTRQINPALLITNDKPEAVFLSGVLPFIALVGADGVAKQNVLCVPSAASLACADDSA